jgi:hypothetical protein
VIGLEDDIRSSMEQAAIFGAFLNELTRPTPAMLWLERAAAELDAFRAARLDHFSPMNPKRLPCQPNKRRESDNGD